MKTGELPQHFQGDLFADAAPAEPLRPRQHLEAIDAKLQQGDLTEAELKSAHDLHESVEQRQVFGDDGQVRTQHWLVTKREGDKPIYTIVKPETAARLGSLKFKSTLEPEVSTPPEQEHIFTKPAVEAVHAVVDVPEQRSAPSVESTKLAHQTLNSIMAYQAQGKPLSSEQIAQVVNLKSLPGLRWDSTLEHVSKTVLNTDTANRIIAAKPAGQPRRVQEALHDNGPDTEVIPAVVDTPHERPRSRPEANWPGQDPDEAIIAQPAPKPESVTSEAGEEFNRKNQEAIKARAAEAAKAARAKEAADEQAKKQAEQQEAEDRAAAEDIRIRSAVATIRAIKDNEDFMDTRKQAGKQIAKYYLDILPDNALVGAVLAPDSDALMDENFEFATQLDDAYTELLAKRLPGVDIEHEDGTWEAVTLDTATLAEILSVKSRKLPKPKDDAETFALDSLYLTKIAAVDDTEAGRALFAKAKGLLKSGPAKERYAQLLQEKNDRDVAPPAPVDPNAVVSEPRLLKRVVQKVLPKRKPAATTRAPREDDSLRDQEKQVAATAEWELKRATSVENKALKYDRNPAERRRMYDTGEFTNLSDIKRAGFEVSLLRNMTGYQLLNKDPRLGLHRDSNGNPVDIMTKEGRLMGEARMKELIEEEQRARNAQNGQSQPRN